MKKLLLSLGVVLLFATQVWASGGDQLIKINSIASGVIMPVSGQVNATIISMPAITGAVTANQGGNWTILDITNPIEVNQNGLWQVNATITNIPAVSQSGNWVIQSITNAVTVQATNLNIRALGYAADSVKIYGSENVPLKTDATGQIYAITSAASVDAIEKAYTFANIATGSWVAVGNYTVTTAKALKIGGVKFTSGYDVEFKVSDGTTGDEIYGQTAPANPNDSVTIAHPGAKAAATVITVYAKASEATNAGTIRIMGFEYTL